jgi:mRNA-degrading endonuclease toxin of MazEF toxin-antitoxin module
MRQYEIWWAALPDPAGRRPVLLLTRTPAYEYLSRITVVEITTVVRGIPQEVLLGRREGLSRASVANLDNVHVVAKRRLTVRIGFLRPDRVPEIKRALGYALDWQELKPA